LTSKSPTKPTPIRLVDKPWGREVWFAQTDLYAGKLLEVDAGGALSIQLHERKDESSYLLSGRALLRQGADAEHLNVERELLPGDVWRNEPGTVHSLEALEDSVIVEVSTPEVDDVVRLADRYGRSD
jgi:mannose-6-phosphate isomerase-like protein (cupin superfamily)